MSQRTPTKWIVVGAVLAAVVVGLGAVVVALLVSRTDSTPSTTTAPPAPESSVATSTSLPPRGVRNGGVVERTVPVEGGSLPRSYLVVEPAEIAEGERLPWVLVLHGIGVSAEQMSSVADWRAAVEQRRFVAVFAQGVMNSWNLGPCCPPATLMGVDDMTYLDTVVSQVGGRDDVDESRQFMTGFSNGALMTYEYGCQNPSTFAAIAPMAGANLTGCRPAQPVSLFHQHANNDFIVPYLGGVGAGSLLTGAVFPSTNDTVSAWAEADGCDPLPVASTIAEGVEQLAWQSCSAGARVELVTIAGMEHNWPVRPGYDPLTAMLEFFGVG